MLHCKYWHKKRQKKKKNQHTKPHEKSVSSHSLMPRGRINGEKKKKKIIKDRIFWDILEDIKRQYEQYLMQETDCATLVFKVII